MIKYRVSFPMSIMEVEVVHETKHFVTVVSKAVGGTYREKKDGTYSQYFDTWEEAHAVLLDAAERRFEATERRLHAIAENLEKIREMKP